VTSTNAIVSFENEVSTTGIRNQTDHSKSII